MRPAPAAAPASTGAIGHPPVDPKFDRQVVAYTGEEKPGTIIIDTPNKFLYLVQEGGKALRYGIGVGRPGFTWAGVKEITAKREWPIGFRRTTRRPAVSRGHTRALSVGEYRWWANQSFLMGMSGTPSSR